MLIFVLASLGYLCATWLVPNFWTRFIFLVVIGLNWSSVCETLGIGPDISIKSVSLLLVYMIILVIIGQLLRF